MTDKSISLEDIFDKLPDDSQKFQTAVSVDDKTRTAFEDINKFVSENAREPTDGPEADYFEKSCYRKLKRIRSQTGMRDALTPLDVHKLLETKEPQSGHLEDIDAENSEKSTSSPLILRDSISQEIIIASEEEFVEAQLPETLDDIFGAMDTLPDIEDENDIFDLKHVKSYAKKIESADYTSQRVPCPDFEKYEPLFEAVKSEIDNGIRQTLPFRKEYAISKGEFFILNGVMVYVAEVGETFEKKGKINARLKVIFSNGKQGSNLSRSLASELYKDSSGRRITDPRLGGLFDNTASDDDIGTGTVYVLRSLSEDSSVKVNRDILHKIGVTSSSVKARISNAEKDPTYLLAPVEVVAEFEIFNVSAQKVEKLLHHYFETARAEITISDRWGNPVKSTEWFFVSPVIIKEAVDRLVDGSLGNTHYDAQAGKIQGH